MSYFLCFYWAIIFFNISEPCSYLTYAILLLSSRRFSFSSSGLRTGETGLIGNSLIYYFLSLFFLGVFKFYYFEAYCFLGCYLTVASSGFVFFLIGFSFKLLMTVCLVMSELTLFLKYDSRGSANEFIRYTPLYISSRVTI